MESYGIFGRMADLCIYSKATRLQVYFFKWMFFLYVLAFVCTETVF